MKKYYLVGIKGAGMSALAQVLADLGNEVIGSDITDYVFTEQALKMKGIKILPFDKENILKYYDYNFIKGNAFNSSNNVEIEQLEKSNIVADTYFDFLGDMLKKYTSIGVTGTHGKTTTTGMLASAFSDEKIAFLIGDGCGRASQNSEYFAFEACEYKRHFLHYSPDYLIITNIEYDHPDYFKDFTDVLQAFYEVTKNTQKFTIAYGDAPGVKELLKTYEVKQVVTYGLTDFNDYRAKNIIYDSKGITFDFYKKTKYIKTFSFPFFGEHMLLNALSVIVVGILEGIDINKLEENLAMFSGVKRRFNIINKEHYTIIDDYAHHPTEITATLAAARQMFPQKQLISIFQPHTFSRVGALHEEFATALKISDVIYITDIFGSARESGAETYPKLILDHLLSAQYLNLNEIEKLLIHTDSILVFMGAGDIQKYISAFNENVK